MRSTGWIHRVIARTEADAAKAVRRLAEHGHQPFITERVPGGIAVDFTSPHQDVDVDYLRPDILPAKETQRG